MIGAVGHLQGRSFVAWLTAGLEARGRAKASSLASKIAAWGQTAIVAVFTDGHLFDLVCQIGQFLTQK